MSTISSAALLLKTVTPPWSPIGIVAAFDRVWPGPKLIDDAVGRTDPCGYRVRKPTASVSVTAMLICTALAVTGTPQELAVIGKSRLPMATSLGGPNGSGIAASTRVSITRHGTIG